MEIFLEWGDGNCFSEPAVAQGHSSLVHLNFHPLAISDVEKLKSARYPAQQHFLSHPSWLLL